MDSTHDPSPDQGPTLILYDFLNQPSSSNVSVADTKVHQDTDEKLDFSLSLSCYDSSSSSFSSSDWERKATHNLEYASSLSKSSHNSEIASTKHHIDKKPLKNGNNVLLDSQETQTLTRPKKETHNPECASSSSLSSYKFQSISTHHHIDQKPLKNGNNGLLDSQETKTLTLTRPILSLSPPDPFTIKKVLEESDVNDLARLMLAKGAVEAHVLAHWDDDTRERFKDKEGVVVKVWDMDMDVELHVKMKTWGRNGSVVINDRWISKFVKRRGLVRGDRIGLFWDRFDRRLVFSVLERVPIDATSINFRSPDRL